MLKPLSFAFFQAIACCYGFLRWSIQLNEARSDWSGQNRERNPNELWVGFLTSGGEGKTAPVINGAVIERVNLDYVGR